MGVASPARVVALRVFSRQRRRDARARELLRASHEMDALGPKGRALASRLVFGANVTRGVLDELIDAAATRPAAIQPQVRDALRLAAFETLYLDTPAQVAVSQGVELVRGVVARAAGMANAVLRRIALSRGRVEAARSYASRLASGGVGDGDVCEALSLVSGYPSWLVARIVRDLGARDAARLCGVALDAAPVYVAPGRADVSHARALELLRKAGLGPEEVWPGGPMRLREPAGLAPSGLVEGCAVVACDLAAQLVARAAASSTGPVLEVGQGRGTKSVLTARACRALGCEAPCVVGCDSVASKVRVASRRMAASGLGDCVSCVELDARRLADPGALPAGLPTWYETVLVDAPCSGTGTMRRHPEIPWSLAEGAVDPSAAGSLPALQLDLLRSASARVRPGGSLCYATCSVLRSENERVVEAFLETPEGRPFERAAVLDAPGMAGLEGLRMVRECVSPDGWLRSVPGAVPFDGHFCARLTRHS